LKTKLALALLVVVSVGLCQAPESLSPETITTFGLMNGRAWNSMDENMRVSYVTGASDALRFSKYADYDSFFRALTAGENSKALTRLYDEPANALIPIIHALGIVVMKTRGASSEEIAVATAKLRRLAAEPPK
jgi:hypothetical protein